MIQKKIWTLFLEKKRQFVNSKYSHAELLRLQVFCWPAWAQKNEHSETSARCFVTLSLRWRSGALALWLALATDPYSRTAHRDG
jgi:hypothetical protein